jgi:hypothetical protein
VPGQPGQGTHQHLDLAMPLHWHPGDSGGGNIEQSLPGVRQIGAVAMQEQDSVLVQAFSRAGKKLKDSEVAGFKTTRDRIKALGGEPIPGTEQHVPRSALDAEGHYRRIATGWGAL